MVRISPLNVFKFVVQFVHVFQLSVCASSCGNTATAVRLVFVEWRRGVEMARYAKRPANEPLTGLFTGPLTARFYLCLLLGR